MRSQVRTNLLRLLNVTSSALFGHEDIFDSRPLDPVSTFADSYTVLCVLYSAVLAAIGSRETR
jgi:hypothetical protein